MAEKFVLVDMAKGTRHISDKFEDGKDKLSELTEHDLEITNKQWEKIQLLTPGDLPFKVGLYEFISTIDGCLCYRQFELCRSNKLTMKGMKAVASKYFEPQPFNKWACRTCGKIHIKNW